MPSGINDNPTRRMTEVFNLRISRLPLIVFTVSNNIINKVSGINRVVYDITSKPPSTIELE